MGAGESASVVQGRLRKGLVDDLIDLVARLPWWMGVMLAVVAYLMLHRIAVQEVATKVLPGQVGGMAVQIFWRQLASIGQYLLPLLCLAGAGVSAYSRWKRQGLVADVAQSLAADALDGMSWQQFEALVGEAFRLEGYQVTETSGGGADGGIDLVLSRGGEKFLVQCKQWRAVKVGVDVVRELYGVMAARGATGGLVVSSGRFTAAAMAFAEGRNVELIDGPRLLALIRPAQMVRDRAAAHAAAPQGQPAKTSPPAVPDCPSCGKPMVLRSARRGARAGEQFWGCIGYPSCRGTRPGS